MLLWYHVLRYICQSDLSSSSIRRCDRERFCTLVVAAARTGLIREIGPIGRGIVNHYYLSTFPSLQLPSRENVSSVQLATLSHAVNHRSWLGDLQEITASSSPRPSDTVPESLGANKPRLKDGDALEANSSPGELPRDTNGPLRTHLAGLDYDTPVSTSVSTLSRLSTWQDSTTYTTYPIRKAYVSPGR